MYKLCKTEQSAARQNALEQGLLKCMLLKDYEEISVSDLCDAMDVPRKSFYRYFSGKDGALHALIDHTLMGFEGFTVPFRRGKNRTLISELEGFFEFWVEHKPLLDALGRNGMRGMLIERAITHALSETVMPNRFLPHETKEMQVEVTVFGVCGLMSMVLTWHRNGYQKTPQEMARVAARLLGQPLFPNADDYL